MYSLDQQITPADCGTVKQVSAFEHLVENDLFLLIVFFYLEELAFTIFQHHNVIKQCLCIVKIYGMFVRKKIASTMLVR